MDSEKKIGSGKNRDSGKKILRQWNKITENKIEIVKKYYTGKKLQIVGKIEILEKNIYTVNKSIQIMKDNRYSGINNIQIVKENRVKKNRDSGK